MPSRITDRVESVTSTHPARSLIKSHLKNPSGSGTLLEGIIVERDVEQPNSGIYRPSNQAPRHIIVLHSALPATLKWRFDGRSQEAKDIVPIVKFLATEGWWITGQTIFANGGYTTR